MKNKKKFKNKNVKKIFNNSFLCKFLNFFLLRIKVTYCVNEKQLNFFGPWIMSQIKEYGVSLCAAATNFSLKCCNILPKSFEQKKICTSFPL